MSKPEGRRRTLRARLAQERKEAEERGGETCAACDTVVPFEFCTFVMAGGISTAYCLECALMADPEGYVALLWDGFDQRAPEREREGGSAPPAA